MLWIFHQVSLWEIQIKYGMGKLSLPRAPEDFLPGAIAQSGMKRRYIEDEGIFFLGKVPAYHNDPFDRLLIAHAMLHGWEFATVDGQIEKYPLRIFKG